VKDETGLFRAVLVALRSRDPEIRNPQGVTMHADRISNGSFMEAGKFSDFSRELFMQTKRQVSR